MANIFLISDTHFGHENIIKYCNRPFKDAEEMDEVMIDRWNSVVTPQDHVWHLGDVFFGPEQRAAEVLGRLKGKKRLILGNHDNGKQKLLHLAFQKIVMWRMFPEFGLLLTHVPVHQSALKIMVSDSGVEGDCGPEKVQMHNIHGHIHQNASPEGPYRNVSVEQLNYTPISIEELRIK